MHGTAAAEAVPPGFDRRTASVGGVGIDYVIGGDGPTVVLLHGYPQSWHEWRGRFIRSMQHPLIWEVAGANWSSVFSGGPS